MEEKLNQTQQQVAETEAEAALKKSLLLIRFCAKS